MRHVDLQTCALFYIPPIIHRTYILLDTRDQILPHILKTPWNTNLECFHKSFYGWVFIVLHKFEGSLKNKPFGDVYQIICLLSYSTRITLPLYTATQIQHDTWC